MIPFNPFLFLISCVLQHATAAKVTHTFSLAPRPSPRPEKPVHDANYHSFSIEFCYMADYAGNNTHPNVFSRQVIQNLKDISGKVPMFRVGGSTQNSAVYYPNQSEAIISPFSSKAATQPGHSFIGPAFMQSFKQFPEGTKYIYGLNFFNPVNETLLDVGDGLAQVVLEANAAYHAIGNALYAFEIGNEVNGWAGGHRRPAGWTLQDYVDEWRRYARAISKNLTGSDSLQLFQGCVFTAPHDVTSSTSWTVANAEAAGMRSDMAKTVADHEYMGANCHYTGPGPTISSTILNRTNILSRLHHHDYLGNITSHSGIPYVLGETNSIGCQGAANISDVMAAAVWAVDYVLYLSSLRVDRVFFHMGTRYAYSSWLPVKFNDTAPRVLPMYYAALFNAHVFAGGDKQTEVLVNGTDFGAYAVYGKGKLESIVGVNLAMWNSTMERDKRPYTALELPAGWDEARVLRLTSPGVEIAGDITFGGQSVDEKGVIVGEKKVERAVGGKVLVGAGEAVLVQR